MKKHEVAAYLIMETTSDPIQPKNVQVIDENKLFYLRFETTLQSFNVKNRNGRIYLGAGMMKSLNADHILELQKKKSWFGEAGHPMSDDIKRILTIDPKLISHKIINHTVDNNFCRGTVETLDSKYGRQMTKHILQGMEPAFSLRALAPLVKKPDGTTLVQGKSHIVTYDWVILPSHKDAYRDESKPIEKIIKTIVDDGNCVKECAITPVHESMLKSFIAEESANIKLVSNVCEVALSSMELSNDLRSVILRESGATYVVPIEDKIKHDINKYMINL